MATWQKSSIPVTFENMTMWPLAASKTWGRGEKVLARWSDNKFYKVTVEYVGSDYYVDKKRDAKKDARKDTKRHDVAAHSFYYPPPLHPEIQHTWHNHLPNLHQLYSLPNISLCSDSLTTSLIWHWHIASLQDSQYLLISPNGSLFSWIWISSGTKPFHVTQLPRNPFLECWFLPLPVKGQLHCLLQIQWKRRFLCKVRHHRQILQSQYCPLTEYGEDSSEYGSSEEGLWQPCAACKSEVAKLMMEKKKFKDVLSSISKLIYCLSILFFVQIQYFTRL